MSYGAGLSTPSSPRDENPRPISRLVRALPSGALLTMPRNLARYEQFLRLHALVDTLAAAHQALDDATLINAVKERLGLARLSPRTLHRDCDFLIGCGYPLDRITLQGPRRNGWSLDRDGVGKVFPAATTLTILELVAFGVARDLLKAFEGTVLWSGIESLRTKIEGIISDQARERAATGRAMFQVETERATRLADHPRMLSAIATAIVEHRLIEVDVAIDGRRANRILEPARLMIRPPAIHLVARERVSAAETRPIVIDLADIERVALRDETFVPHPEHPPPPDSREHL